MPAVGQRMLEQLPDDLGRRGHHVGADLRRLDARGSDGARWRPGSASRNRNCRRSGGCRRSAAMPSKPTSSCRPTNGEMKVAPALAASSAWAAEKHRVTLTIVPSPVSALHAFEPVWRQRHLDRDIVGDLPQHLGLAHHALIVERDDLGRTGPLTIAAISRTTSRKSRPDLWIRRRVGGDAVEQAGLGKLADFGDFGSVGEEFHGICVRPGFGGWARHSQCGGRVIRFERTRLSDHVRVERERRRAGDHPGPAGAAQCDHRRHVCRAGRSDRECRPTIGDPR